jgi:hypothetical protein
MADYYPIIARAVSGLHSNTAEGRHALYDRARTAVLAQLRGQDPPVPELRIVRETEALEAAIRKLEASYTAESKTGQAPTIEPDRNLPTAPPVEIGNEYRLHPQTAARTNTAANAIKGVGSIMLGIASFAAIIFVSVIFIRGLAWVSEHLIGYLTFPVSAALVLCLFVFLPLALFRKTRFISVYGFLISSFLFGATTWILGFLTTLEYWGGIGVFIGLFLGIVGIVPLGIIASVFHTDWWSFGGLIVGLFVTFGSRMIALSLAATLEKVAPDAPTVSPPRKAATPSDLQTASDEVRPLERGGEVGKERGNYFVRHWRGELSLPVSYWVNGILAGVLAAVAIIVISTNIDVKNNFRPDVAFLLVISMYASLYLLQIWQTVGTWRSATTYGLRWPRRWWGAVVKVMLVFAVLGTLSNFARRDAPRIAEFYKIYNGDEALGSHAFRVLRDGRELEFSGGINFGTAKEFKSFLDAMGAIQVVHLNSVGGRIEEARRIGTLIKDRGLITYVANQCDSACTLIFLNGRERWIAENARLGFHAPTFPGMNASELAEAALEEKRILVGLGVPESFADKAIHTPNSSMWFPSTQELASAHIVSGVADPSRFAASGVSVQSMNIGEVSSALSNIPLYAAIAKVYPDLFREITEQMSHGYKVGLPQSEIMASLRPKVISLVRKNLIGAAEDLVLQFNDINIEYLSGLQIKDAESCAAFAVGSSKYAIQRIDLTKEFPQIADRELKLYAEIILSGYNSKRQVPRLGDIQESFKRVGARLLDRVGKRDYEAFLKGDAEPGNFAGFCRASVEFFKAVPLLPNNERIPILRYLYSQAGAETAAVSTSMDSGGLVSNTDYRSVDVTPVAQDRNASFRLSSVDGNFAVEFPKEPKFEKEHGSTAGLPYDQYAWSLEQGGRYWTVTYQVHPASIKWNYDGAVKGVLESVKGRLVQQLSITQAGVVGRELLVEASGYRMRQRILYCGNGRVYQLVYVGPPGSELNNDVDVFMKSFNLL